MSRFSDARKGVARTSKAKPAPRLLIIAALAILAWLPVLLIGWLIWNALS